MKMILKPTVVALFLGLAMPAAADDDFLPEAEEALQRMLSLLEVIVGSIPQYELPEVLENGDIIIRRVQPEPGEDPEEATEDESKEI